MKNRFLHIAIWCANLALLALIALWIISFRAGYVARSWSNEPLTPSSFLQEVRTKKSPAATSNVSAIPVPILTYHYTRVVSPSEDPLGYRLSVPPGDLGLQLDAFKHRGYEPITLKDFAAGKVNERSIILTFDDGYRDFYENAFPLLKARGVTAVAFVTTGFLNDKDNNYLTDAMVKEIHANGIEIGAHTITHPNLANSSPAKIRTELLESRFKLEELINDRVTSVSYPSGKYSDDVLRLSAFVGYTEGVTTDFGAATLANDQLTLPRIEVIGGTSVDDVLEKIDEAKTQTATRLD